MKTSLSTVKQPKKYDFVLLGIIITMAITSIVAIYSAFELLPAHVSGPDLIFKQVLWYAIGFAGIAAIMFIGNEGIYDLAKIVYWILIGALLLLVLNQIVNMIFGNNTNLPFIHKTNGATSWFYLPFGSLQPSEFMKVDLIVLTAGLISKHHKEYYEASYENDVILFVSILKYALPALFLIYIQPDTGICLIIIVSLSIMIMCSGIKPGWIIGAFVGVGIILGIFFFFFFFYNDQLMRFFGGSYKLNRIVGWIYPEQNLIGAGQQLYTALLAIGSAGLFGYGMKTKVVTLLEPQTDFIFAVFSQSFGLIGSLFIIALCVLLDWRLFKIAIQSKVSFEKYIVCGILGMLLFQQIENIGMVIGLLPITGVTLPFISYGGSSLLSYLLALGIVMNTSSQAKKLSDYVYK
ncbi:MAG: FtsW/RodA/SpoVE family cell cycle protein [Erysipelotrichaceae bacterium]